MDARSRWSRISCLTGLIAMLIGCIDPMEGSLLILPGTALVALGAYLSASRHRKLAYWALGFTALGVALLFGLSSVGGVGGDTGRSLAWTIILVPYPVGAVLALVTDARLLVELFRG